jgi:zinc transport system substrate-binding protein
VLTAALLAGCGPQPATPAKSVVATFYPLYELAREVGGDRVEVRQLVPSGVEVHDYEPTSGDLARLREAAVFVYNGAGLEPWLSKLEGELPAGTVRVEATRGLPLVRAEAHGHAEELGHTGQPDRLLDPHVWLDPVLAQAVVDNILDGLVRADPAGEATYRRRALAAKQRLEQVHRRYQRALARCRTRVLLTSHAAFGYLARRYGLRLVSVAGVNPEAEPSPRRLRQLLALARQEGVRAVFAESRGSQRAAESLARELGLPVRVLDPLEAGPRPGQDYIRRVEANLEELVRGLGCNTSEPAGGGR